MRRFPAAFLPFTPMAGPLAHADDEVTAASRTSIDKAVAWIMKAQNRDGS